VIFTAGPSELRMVVMNTVTAYAHFVHEDTSRAGCGLLLPCIAYFANWALEKVMSRRHLEDSLV
jgi:hypothetical protein